MALKLSIPGQLKGTNCAPVMLALIALRKAREEAFAAATSELFDEVCVIFRVGGAVASFGADAIEHVYVQQSSLCCEVVLASRDWSALGPDAIGELVGSRFSEAIAEMRRTEYGAELSGIPD